MDEDGTVTLSPTQPQVDTALTATLIDPDGTVSGTTWKWESSGDGSSGWTTITGATDAVTTSSYTPTAADVDKFLRTTATYTDPQGSGKSAQAVSNNAVQSAPVFNVEPTFSTATDTRTVAENTAAGQDIGAPVAADDPDTGDMLSYTLGGTDAASFGIVASTGRLRTKVALDHETKDTYTVEVSVSDGKDANGNADTADDASIRVTIAVDDVNEAPAFSAETDSRTIPENTPAGENIGDPVAATDPDDGDTVTYSLDTDSATSFDIVASTGQLQTKAALDFETKSTYTVTVSVRDSKDSSGTADMATDNTTTVTINVDNVDEDGTVTLSPTQPQVDTALTATLTDPDGTVSGTTWKWESSEDGSSDWTTITGATDAVTTSSYTPAAADLGKYLRATATYTDVHGSKSAESVSANPVNAAPEFSEENATRSVDENTEAGHAIGTPVTATDADTLTYTLGGTDAASFSIVSGTGQLQTRAALDFEGKSSYKVTVIATDASGAATSIPVTITVNNLEEAGTVTLTLLQPQVGTEQTATLEDPDGTLPEFPGSGP